MIRDPIDVVPHEPKPATVTDTSTDDDFARQAHGTSPGLIREFVDFLVFNKAWWLAPIIIVLLLVGVLIVINSVAGALPIYPLF